jgi:hypothetical protein
LLHRNNIKVLWQCVSKNKKQHLLQDKTGKNWQRSTRLEDLRKNIGGKQLSILKSISKEVKENWDETYMVAKYNPGPICQGKKWTKRRPDKLHKSTSQSCCKLSN